MGRGDSEGWRTTQSTQEYLFICRIKCSYCENAKQSAILPNREVTPKAVKISGGGDFIDADDSESL